jgi:putative ABC transport system substrate-binding protein
MVALGRLALGVALSLVAVAGASAQPPANRLYRIGVLETTSLTRNAANIEALKQGLGELGYIEGRNFVIEYRSADGRPERYRDLVADLVRLKVDVIMTRGTPAALAAKAATATIPIVMTSSGDPVATGIVPGLAQPGGNVTGLSAMVGELGGKRLELLKLALPGLARVGHISNRSNPAFINAWPVVEQAARSLRLEVFVLDVRKPEDLEPAFDAAAGRRADAVVITLDSVTLTHYQRITELAVKHRLPSISPAREFAEAGSLMSYGTNYADLYRRSATYVDRIFKGAKPGDLPIEQASKFELVINLRAARALGVTLPQTLTLRADHLIR